MIMLSKTPRAPESSGCSNMLSTIHRVPESSGFSKMLSKANKYKITSSPSRLRAWPGVRCLLIAFSLLIGTALAASETQYRLREVCQIKITESGLTGKAKSLFPAAGKRSTLETDETVAVRELMEEIWGKELVSPDPENIELQKHLRDCLDTEDEKSSNSAYTFIKASGSYKHLTGDNYYEKVVTKLQVDKLPKKEYGDLQKLLTSTKSRCMVISEDKTITNFDPKSLLNENKDLEKKLSAKEEEHCTKDGFATALEKLMPKVMNLFKGVGLPADKEAVQVRSEGEPGVNPKYYAALDHFKIPGEDEQTTHIPLVGTKEWFAEDKQRCGKTCQVMTADEIDEAFYRQHNMSLEGEIKGKVQKTPENLKNEVRLGETTIHVINDKVYRTCHLATMEIDVPEEFLPDKLRMGAKDVDTMSPSERVISRRRMAHGARVSPVLAALMEEIEEAKRTHAARY